MTFNIDTQLCTLIEIDLLSKHDINFVIDVLTSLGKLKNGMYFYDTELLDYIRLKLNVKTRNKFNLTHLSTCVYKSIIETPYDKYVCIDIKTNDIKQLNIDI